AITGPRPHPQRTRGASCRTTPTPRPSALGQNPPCSDGSAPAPPLPPSPTATSLPCAPGATASSPHSPSTTGPPCPTSTPPTCPRPSGHAPTPTVRPPWSTADPATCTRPTPGLWSAPPTGSPCHASSPCTKTPP